jgi:hypothetical protein
MLRNLDLVTVVLGWSCHRSKEKGLKNNLAQVLSFTGDSPFAHKMDPRARSKTSRMIEGERPEVNQK